MHLLQVVQIENRMTSFAHQENCPRLELSTVVAGTEKSRMKRAL